MACPEPEQIEAAPPPPGFSTPTKAIRNDRAGHAGQDAERMETESEADVEKEFEKSTGKKRRNAGPLVYRFVKQWTTGSKAKLEPNEIEHQIYTEMKNYMHASGLKKTPGHRPKDTDIHLWKQSLSSVQKNITTRRMPSGSEYSDAQCIIDSDVKRR